MWDDDDEDEPRPFMNPIGGYTNSSGESTGRPNYPVLHSFLLPTTTMGMDNYMGVILGGPLHPGKVRILNFCWRGQLPVDLIAYQDAGSLWKVMDNVSACDLTAYTDTQKGPASIMREVWLGFNADTGMPQATMLACFPAVVGGATELVEATRRLTPAVEEAIRALFYPSPVELPQSVATLQQMLGLEMPIK